MRGELLGGMPQASVYLGGGPVVVPRQAGLEFVVLELPPLSASRAGPNRSARDSGADDIGARVAVVCALCHLSEARSPRDSSRRKGYRQVRIQDAFPGLRGPRDLSNAEPKRREALRGSLDV